MSEPRTHRKRCVQLSIVIALSFLLMALYNIQIANLKEELENLQTEKNALILSDLSETTANSTPDIYYPPVVSEPDRSTDSTTQNTIQDIFNTRHNIDSIKTRYEEIFVTYFIMKKCQKASDSDYQLILAELQKETVDFYAPIRLQNDILTAAKGSYEELYSRNDCSQSSMEDSFSQYTNYINSLSSKNNQTSDKIIDNSIAP